MELVVATKNIKKLQEIKDILKGLDVRVSSIADYPGSPRIVENGRTFKANAAKKVVKRAILTAFLAALALTVGLLRPTPPRRRSRSRVLPEN